MMNDLGFELFDKPHSPGHTVPFLRFDSGVERRASAEEKTLWEALQESRRQLEERQPARGKR